jgi:hypothetical protein
MAEFVREWDVEGPIQAEIFVIWLNQDHLELTGPCGAAAWYVELGTTDHPVEVVTRLARNALGAPRLVHSTSWRRDPERDTIILSFVVVVDSAGEMESVPIGRSELARSSATAAPAAIDYSQVIEHGLRHLAWLAKDDPVVSEELSPSWKQILAGYVPEPFRTLG